ncbi:MFS transporter [Candidatus Woesearchaeota archaeon]|nr:MFS transporter [Candidatus Woesearchaeota archaeon]
MATFHHLYRHIKLYGSRHRILYVAALMVFFWTIFDGIISYFTPIVITDAGISESLMGIIIGSSSIAGMFFDFLLCYIIRKPSYRRIYLSMFIFSLLYPLFLWGSKAIIMYFIAMALWGFYYDLFHIGSFDFVSKKTKESEHTSSFGVMNVFSSLGYLLAPVIAAFFASKYITIKPYIIGWVFLGIAFVFYIILLLIGKNKQNTKETKDKEDNTKSHSNFFKELHLWKKIGVSTLPVLLLILTLNIIDSFFWTIGPLISENISELGELGGLFLASYQLPSLLVGWFAGNVTAKLGKKKTAFISLLIGSLIFSMFFFVAPSILLIIITFCASFFIGLAWPAVNGAFADYISEAPKVDKEIETIEDAFINLGYIVGPVIAGFAGEYLGYVQTFGWMGVGGVIIAIILLKVTPRKITVENKSN